MTTFALPRLGAACGAVFAIGLFIATGDGSQSYSAPREILGIVALTALIPFAAVVSARLRPAEAPSGWLSGAALAAGTTAAAIKLGSVAPELAAHNAGVTADSELGTVLSHIADGTTLLSLFPLAAFCAAVAIEALRSRALPRTLAIAAAVVAIALIANASLLGTAAVPAFLLFLLWALVTSGYLLFRPVRRAAVAAQPA